MHCSDEQLIDQWKKGTDFVQIKFQLNENTECHCMQIELNSNASNGI
jgi:hypothetical protein